MDASRAARTGRNTPAPPARRLGRALRTAAFVLAQVVAAGALGIVLLRTGPFEATRRFVIGSTMTSYRHQYIAKLLFSQPEIDAVMNSGKTDNTNNTPSESTIKPKGTHDDSITRSTIGDGLSGQVLEIANPLRVHVDYTKYIGERGEKVSVMAKRNNAVAAINGGGFYSGASTTGSGDTPSYFVFSKGQLAWTADGLNLNSKLDKDSNVIALTATGELLVGRYSVNDLKAKNVTEAVQMGGYEPLVQGGKSQYKDGDDAGKGMQPRTAIGQKPDGTIVMVVLDGRQLLSGAAGAYIYQLADLMVQLGCDRAANLDGGGSTAMYYQGKIINKPSQLFGERTVATAFYVSP